MCIRKSGFNWNEDALTLRLNHSKEGQKAQCYNPVTMEVEQPIECLNTVVGTQLLWVLTCVATFAAGHQHFLFSLLCFSIEIPPKAIQHCISFDVTLQSVNLTLR